MAYQPCCFWTCGETIDHISNSKILSTNDWHHDSWHLLAVTLVMLLKTSVSPFVNLENGDNKNVYLIGLWGFNKLICIKHFKQRITYQMCHVTLCYEHYSYHTEHLLCAQGDEAQSHLRFWHWFYVSTPNHSPASISNYLPSCSPSPSQVFVLCLCILALLQLSFSFFISFPLPQCWRWWLTITTVTSEIQFQWLKHIFFFFSPT